MINLFRLFIFDLSGQHGTYDINIDSIVSCFNCFIADSWSLEV